MMFSLSEEEHQFIVAADRRRRRVDSSVDPLLGTGYRPDLSIVTDHPFHGFKSTDARLKGDLFRIGLRGKDSNIESELDSHLALIDFRDLTEVHVDLRVRYVQVVAHQ